MSYLRTLLNRIAALFRRGQVSVLPPPVEVEATDENLLKPQSYGDDGYPPFAIDRRMGKFQIGQVVKHRLFEFRGVIFDVDPVFANSDEWYEAIPEHLRPSKDQPYYHLFAENDQTHYVAYVSEGNLVPDESDTPVTHPDIPQFFDRTPEGYTLKPSQAH